jgi:hypothetical protein
MEQISSGQGGVPREQHPGGCDVLPLYRPYVRKIVCKPERCVKSGQPACREVGVVQLLQHLGRRRHGKGPAKNLGVRAGSARCGIPAGDPGTGRAAQFAQDMADVVLDGAL